jgi:hypothetical protein
LLGEIDPPAGPPSDGPPSDDASTDGGQH